SPWSSLTSTRPAWTSFSRKASVMLQRSFEPSRCGRLPPSLHCTRQGHQHEAVMTQRSAPGTERPRVEPGIIPPGDVRSRRAGASFDGTQRVYVARVGPFGFVILALVIAALAMLLFLLVLGAFVILIPLAGLLLAVIIAVGLFRVLIWRRLLVGRRGGVFPRGICGAPGPQNFGRVASRGGTRPRGLVRIMEGG